VLQVADHFDNGTVCTPRLAAAAAVTSTLRLGSYVYNNDARHPVLVAREAAEIDLLSEGRMELGLGAGWNKEEYDRVGLRFDPGGTRAARYQEAVRIIRLLHETGVATLDGSHYQVNECELIVEPVQRPIPLLLGGGGPRMTAFAGLHADTVAFVPRSLPGGGLAPEEFSAAAFSDKIARLDEAEQIRTSAPAERAVLAFEVCRSIDELPTDGWAPPELIADGPYCLVGDTARLIETILERRERWGISHWTCWEEDLDAFVPIIDALAGA
jgi:probable F420-dependent oxidoreductase